MPKRSVSVQDDFPFHFHLLQFYQANKGKIKSHYRELTKRFLDFNDPKGNQENPFITKIGREVFLRRPQFEALEMYVFLKEFLDNEQIHTIFRDWADKTGKFAERAATTTTAGQGILFEEQTRETYDLVFSQIRSYARTYPNYIFALTMGTGKTILIATCIFYEFLLANKFPKELKYCHNALVFAPDTTVLQSLREIQTFDKSRVVPPDYLPWLEANLRIHFLDEAGMTLNVIDRSRYNLIISNTQKVILRRRHTEQSLVNKLMHSAPPPTPGSVFSEFGDVFATSEPFTDSDLAYNQRYKKLERLSQLGIFVDEAHHAFGKQLAEDMGAGDARTSLRLTIDELAASLKRAGTHVVACYNYTGTPYAQNRILPEVVYAFSLNEAINGRYLKKIKITDYSNTRSAEFVDFAIGDFLQHVPIDQRHERLLPKMAFFAATIEELQNELRPAVETALAKHGIPSTKILVNVGDQKVTSNDDIREFNRLDTPNSDKQFILLVNKGREGWNCRSLFSVALFRKPKSKIFVLQATMRCLRAIGDIQNRGYIYLSEENVKILDDELQQNFRVTVTDIQAQGEPDKETIQVHVKEPIPTITLTRERHLYQTRDKKLTPGLDLELDEAPVDHYRIISHSREGFDLTIRETTEDLTGQKRRRHFSPLTLVAEIASYLNRSCIEIENVLSNSKQGMSAIVTKVNEFNDLLYDWIIPHLFKAFYDLIEYDYHEKSPPIKLINEAPNGYYEINATPNQLIRETDVESVYRPKSFHLDVYKFDSQPEQTLFMKILQDSRVQSIYFTGMMTHGQSDFYIQYIDPLTHLIRHYYPDFLVKTNDGNYIVIEVKGENKLDDPIVLAKAEFANKFANVNNMTYRIIPSADARTGQLATIWNTDAQNNYIKQLQLSLEHATL